MKVSRLLIGKFPGKSEACLTPRTSSGYTIDRLNGLKHGFTNEDKHFIRFVGRGKDVFPMVLGGIKFSYESGTVIYTRKMWNLEFCRKGNQMTIIRFFDICHFRMIFRLC